MTREDAIKHLQHCSKWNDKPQKEALELAIKALEHPEENVVAIVPCGDAISRQAVLDYIDNMPSELTSDGRRMVRRRTLEEYISDTLSSVNPQPKTGHWILDETDNSITCDKCGCLIWANDISNGEAHYCPNCGAKMV